MNGQERERAQQAESGLPTRDAEDRAEKKNADRPDPMRNIAQSAGNNAMSQMIAGNQRGVPLRDDFRSQMERRLGVSLASVRIHDDAASHQSAAAVQADAYTAGDQIMMGSEAPSLDEPGGQDSLAHELVHVVQQRKASAIQSGVNAPGDRFESEANSASQQAGMGETIGVRAGGTVPAVQRQPTGTLRMREQAPNASRAEVEQAIFTYLQRAQTAQGGKSVRLTEPVKSALRALAAANTPGNAVDSGKAARSVSMEALLNGSSFDAAELARRAAQILPDPFYRAALKKLETMPAAEPPGGFIDRAKESAEKNLKTPDSPSGDLVPDPKKRLDDEMDKMRAARGGPQGHGIGPVAVDPFAIGRVIKDVTSKPKSPARNIQPRDYPEVDQAISKIAPDALMPPEAKGKGSEGEYVDQAQDVARDLAAKLDVAQQKNSEMVELHLPPAYHRSQSRPAMIDAVVKMVQAIRQALPHHASNVQYVDLFFGDMRVQRITIGSGH
jgi:hypothetical protein